MPACGEPVTFYSDEAVGVVARTAFPPEGGERRVESVGISPKFEPRGGAAGLKRSPSFDNANIVPGDYVALPAPNVTYTSLATTDGTYYLMAMETPTGTLYNDSNGVDFYLNGTQGSVHWDADVYRFVVIENGDSGFIYLHLNTSAALASHSSWETFVFANVSGANPMLGIWPQAYVVGIAASSNNMCVLNRAEILNTSLIPENATGPAHFCATSISGGLAGFANPRASWTPLGVRSVSTVSAEVESAGTGSVGAVWMRHHDDELHNGAVTPLFDWIDVEHWTNINWTTHDYISLRYAVSISDFDSSFAHCPDANACIPTPEAGVYVDARRENIMPNLHYASNGRRVTAVFTSHANGISVANVRWVELVWQSPTNLLAARFILSQQGNITDTAVHRWNPTAFMDADGTTVVGYNVANNDTVWPGMRASSRLLNDRTNGMRQEVVVLDGEASNVGALAWGPWATLDSAVPRNFTYCGAVSVSQVARHLRITGNVIHRTFTGANNCNQTTCVQVIVEQ